MLCVCACCRSPRWRAACCCSSWAHAVRGEKQQSIEAPAAEQRSKCPCYSCASESGALRTLDSYCTYLRTVTVLQCLQEHGLHAPELFSEARHFAFHRLWDVFREVCRAFELPSHALTACRRSQESIGTSVRQNQPVSLTSMSTHGYQLSALPGLLARFRGFRASGQQRPWLVLVCCGFQLQIVASSALLRRDENFSGTWPEKTETTLSRSHPSLPRPFRAREAVRNGNVSSPMRNPLAQPSRCVLLQSYNYVWA